MVEKQSQRREGAPACVRGRKGARGVWGWGGLTQGVEGGVWVVRLDKAAGRRRSSKRGGDDLMRDAQQPLKCEK